MALKIVNNRIVGTICNLEEKLAGKLPVTREELLVLVNSWGRILEFETETSDNQMIIIDKCEPKECYDLSKLNTSEITNMSRVFSNSYFNGDISNLDMSNATDMSYMCFNAVKFNQPLNFNTPKLTNTSYMLCYAESFNQPINIVTTNVTNMSYMLFEAILFDQPLNIDTSSVLNMEKILYGAIAFFNKYNNGKELPNYTDGIKAWINNNRDRMNEKNDFLEELEKFNPVGTKILVEFEISKDNGYIELMACLMDSKRVTDLEDFIGVKINKIYHKDVTIPDDDVQTLLERVLDKIKKHKADGYSI